MWSWAPTSLSPLEWLLLLPVACGSLYSLACLAAMARLKASAQRRRPIPERWSPAEAPALPLLSSWPAVTLLKPVCGLERGLRENLLSACAQDYPGPLQVILSAQDEDDPAIPLLREIAREAGAGRAEVVVDSTPTAPNGKIRNLLGALPHARHDLLVISDSDVRLRPDYLRALVPALADPAVGCACTLYRAAGARRWFELLEQLTLNADFVPNLVFAHTTGASRFLLGVSTALRRTTLAEIGGLAALSDYLVEDFEMGRRVLAAGKRVAVVPYFVDTQVDLKGPGQWWQHQVYWDQNTRSANPWGHLGTFLLRAIPFALLFALVRLAHAPDALAAAVPAAALAIRLGTAGVFMGWGLGDRTGVRNLGWLPLRDLAGLVSAVLAFTRPTVVWRGVRFRLTRDGRMERETPSAPRDPAPSEEPAA